MNKILRRSERIAHLERVVRELEWLLADAPYTDGTSEDRENLHRRIADALSAFDYSLQFNQLARQRESASPASPASDLTSETIS